MYKVISEEGDTMYDKTRSAEAYTTGSGRTYEIMHNPNWGFFANGGDLWSGYEEEVDEVRAWCEWHSTYDPASDLALSDGHTWAM